LYVLQEARGYPAIWELASGFGGGIGRKGDVCGAITGGVIAIGYEASQRHSDRREIAALARDPSCKLYEGFQEAFGSVDCRQITGCDLSTPEGYQEFRQGTTLQEKCRPCVEWVIHTLLTEEGGPS
jgi:C_GCAxxG_C_C family probable redox protein